MNKSLRAILLALLIIYLISFGVASWINGGDIRLSGIIALIMCIAAAPVPFLVFSGRGPGRRPKPARSIFDRIDTENPFVWVAVMVVGVAILFWIAWGRRFY